MKRNPNCNCVTCGVGIYKRPKELEHKVFCSRSCYHINTRKTSPCIVCGNAILASKHAKTCSRKCANAGRKGVKYNLGSPNSNASKNKRLRLKLSENRGNKCENCGHNNTNILQAHHIKPKAEGGGDELTNLKLLCPNCHYTEHLGDSRTNKHHE